MEQHHVGLHHGARNILPRPVVYTDRCAVIVQKADVAMALADCGHILFTNVRNGERLDGVVHRIGDNGAGAGASLFKVANLIRLP